MCPVDPPSDRAPHPHTKVGPGRGETMLLPDADAVASLEARGGGPGRVLVCEARLDHADAIAEPLKGRGVSVVVLRHPEALVDAAEFFQPHAVFVAADAHPEDALAAISKLRACASSNGWLVVGTGESDASSARALAAGCDLHFARPLSVEQLQEVLSRCIVPRPDPQ